MTSEIIQSLLSKAKVFSFALKKMTPREVTTDLLTTLLADVGVPVNPDNFAKVFEKYFRSQSTPHKNVWELVQDPAFQDDVGSVFITSSDKEMDSMLPVASCPTCNTIFAL